MNQINTELKEKPALKICHLTSMHDWDDDRIFQRACVGLARLGHDVSLVALKRDPSDKDVFNHMGVTIYLLPSLSGVKRRLKGSKAVVNKALELNAQVFQFHDPDLLPYVRRLGKTATKPVVIYDIHENYAGRFSNWGLPSFLGSFFRKYENSVIRSLSGITVVSDSMKDLFVNTKTPIEITRNSTDVDRLSELDLPSRDQNSKREIITSGSHSHARNCLQTVNALEFMDHKFMDEQNFELKFVGRYLEGIEEEMSQAAEGFGCASFLKLEGMKPWEENFKRISTAFAGCVFYADNDNNRVGIPNRLFEYMYCGLPVIVSNFPELKQIVEDAECGIIVNSEDSEDIARGFIQLLKDPNSSERMGKNGKEAILKKYGYHVDLKKLEDFYVELLSKDS